MIGYLEQTVATMLTDALTSVGKFKPKHPFISASRSAAEYLGLYLKSRNSKSQPWLKAKYTKRLEAYKEKCLLVNSLCGDIPIDGSFLETADRRLDFQDNLCKFQELLGSSE